MRRPSRRSSPLTSAYARAEGRGTWLYGVPRVGYSLEQTASIEQGRRPAKTAFTAAAEHAEIDGSERRGVNSLHRKPDRGMMSTQRAVGAADGELSWFKSSYSGGSGGNCVEVAEAADAVRVRDTKDRCGFTLSVSGRQWAAFVTYVIERAR